MQAVMIKEMIKPIRRKMPRYGAEKLYLDIKDNLTKHNIKMGRDGFLKFCRPYRLLGERGEALSPLILNTFIISRPTW